MKPFKYQWPKEGVTISIITDGHYGGGDVRRSDKEHKLDEIIRGLETISKQIEDLKPGEWWLTTALSPTAEKRSGSYPRYVSITEAENEKP